MRTLILTSLAALLGTFAGFGLGAYWLSTKLQPLRMTLESIVLSQPINIRNRSLQEVSKELVAEMKYQKGSEITCIFSPDSLANEMPISFSALHGNAFFAVHGLAKSYRCQAELVGDRVILFMRSDKSAATSVEQ